MALSVGDRCFFYSESRNKVVRSWVTFLHSAGELEGIVPFTVDSDGHSVVAFETFGEALTRGHDRLTVHLLNAVDAVGQAERNHIAATLVYEETRCELASRTNVASWARQDLDKLLKFREVDCDTDPAPPPGAGAPVAVPPLGGAS